MRPLQAEHASPELLYADFAKAATGAARGLQDFTALMRDAQSNEIRAWVKERTDSSDDGIVNWLVTQHPDWLQRPVLSPRGPPKAEEGEQRVKKVGEGVEEDVKEFVEAHPGTSVHLDAANKMIEVGTGSELDRRWL